MRTLKQLAEERTKLLDIEWEHQHPNGRWFVKTYYSHLRKYLDNKSQCVIGRVLKRPRAGVGVKTISTIDSSFSSVNGTVKWFNTLQALERWVDNQFEKTSIYTVELEKTLELEGFK